MSDAGAVIAAEGLEVRYHGGPDPAVRGIDLVVRAGEGLLVTGASGSGKTSLVRSLLGLVLHQGRLEVMGGEPGAPHTRGRVGYGPQGTGFAPDLRVREAARLAAAVRGLPAPRAAADEALERAGLGYVTDWRTRRLDAEGGRRLSLAFAIAGDPDLVVLDDAWALTDAIREIGRARRRGATVLVTATARAGLAPALGRSIRLVDGAIA
ncbi:MAG: ATP-binding cassette domain-containing protein [Thermoleophilia bacterium]